MKNVIAFLIFPFLIFACSKADEAQLPDLTWEQQMQMVEEFLTDLETAAEASEADRVPLPTGYPAFPERRLDDYPDDPNEIEKLSNDGDGYATLILGLRKQCGKEDVACVAQKIALLEKAVDQGETVAAVAIRDLRINRDPSYAETVQPAASVCGLTTDDLESVSAAITAFNFPGYGEAPRAPEKWQLEDASGDRGSEAMIFTNGAFDIHLIFNEGKLKTMRSSNSIDLGTFPEWGADEVWKAAYDLQRDVAKLICPNWENLGLAINHYFEKVAVTWPPGAVHFEGEGAWLAAGGVTPDIFWFDLYVDPNHWPFRSSFREEFDRSIGIFLGAKVTKVED